MTSNMQTSVTVTVSIAATIYMREIWLHDMDNEQRVWNVYKWPSKVMYFNIAVLVTYFIVIWSW